MPQDQNLQPDPNLYPVPAQPGDPMKLTSETQERSEPSGQHATDFRHSAEPMTGQAQPQSHQGESHQQSADVRTRAREGVRSASEQAQQTLHETADSVRQTGTSFLSNGKTRAAEELSHFSAAIREAGQKLHEEEDHQIADYTEVVAEKVDRVSGYLRQSELGDLVADVEQMTRRRPEFVLGGMFLLGIGLSRFLKSSGRRRREF